MDSPHRTEPSSFAARPTRTALWEPRITRLVPRPVFRKYIVHLRRNLSISCAFRMRRRVSGRSANDTLPGSSFDVCLLSRSRFPNQSPSLKDRSQRIFYFRAISANTSRGVVYIEQIDRLCGRCVAHLVAAKTREKQTAKLRKKERQKGRCRRTASYYQAEV